MSQSIDVSFDYDCSVYDMQQRVSESSPPFNSGIWTFRYKATLDLITLECEQVTEFVVVESVTLATQTAQKVSQYDRSTDGGLSHATFPPVPTWSISCPANQEGWNNSSGASRAVLTVKHANERFAPLTLQ